MGVHSSRDWSQRGWRHGWSDTASVSSGRRTNWVDARPESDRVARLLIHVEGETEETFVNEVLEPHLCSRGYSQVSARLMGNARQRDRRGGIRSWSMVKEDIVTHLKQDRQCLASCMVDYYALPQTGERAWPGRNAAGNL